MVQYELEPEIIASTTSASPSNTEGGVKQRKNKKEKQKPILLNREEKSLVKVGSNITPSVVNREKSLVKVGSNVSPSLVNREE